MTQPDYQGAVPYASSDSHYAHAYTAKLDELLAAGRHPLDAAWEARRHAREKQERELSVSEATHNATVVAALGISYGATPHSNLQSTEPAAEEAVAVDWDEAFGPGPATGPADARKPTPDEFWDDAFSRAGSGSTSEEADIDAVDWDSVFSDLNANRNH